MQTAQYTPEQVDQLVKAYVDEKLSPGFIADRMGKTQRSVIAKLAQLGVYTPNQRETKPRLTKAKLIDEIALHLNAEREVLDSLEKATLIALVTLHSALGINED